MNNKFDDEIDLILVLKELYKSKKTIIYISLLFGFIGIYIALSSPLKFNSSTVFITQNENSSANSSLSGVASLVGINLSSVSGSEITSSMYPLVAESPKFKRLLLETIIDKESKINIKIIYNW